MFPIVHAAALTPLVTRLDIQAPLIAKKAQPGQFVIVRHGELGERIPLTIADFDREQGTITLIIQRLGKSTHELGALQAGQALQDLVGPLGQPTHYPTNLKRVLAVGGGVGVAPLYPQLKMLAEAGVQIDAIVGARGAEHLILVKELEAICHHVFVTTDDGSAGHHGRVTDIAKRLLEQGEQYDHAIAIGPLIMMKAVTELTKGYDLSTTVSLNPIMIDGTGMCGGCRVTVGGQVRFACVDGPEFDGHLVDFDEAMRRQQMYRGHEKQALDAHVCRLGGANRE